MIFCKKCKRLVVYGEYCIYCGDKLPLTENFGVMIIDAIHCPKCCDADPPDATYCRHCGKPLNAEDQKALSINTPEDKRKEGAP